MGQHAKAAAQPDRVSGFHRHHSRAPDHLLRQLDRVERFDRARRQRAGVQDQVRRNRLVRHREVVNVLRVVSRFDAGPGAESMNDVDAVVRPQDIAPGGERAHRIGPRVKKGASVRMQTGFPYPACDDVPD